MGRTGRLEQLHADLRKHWREAEHPARTEDSALTEHPAHTEDHTRSSNGATALAAYPGTDTRSWRRRAAALLRRYRTMAAGSEGAPTSDVDLLATAMAEALTGQLATARMDALQRALSPAPAQPTPEELAAATPDGQLAELTTQVPARAQAALRRRQGRTARELAAYQVLVAVAAEAVDLAPGQRLPPPLLEALRALGTNSEAPLPLTEELPGPPLLHAGGPPTVVHVRAILLTFDVAGPLYRTYVRLDPLTARGLRSGGLTALETTLLRRTQRHPTVDHLADLTADNLGTLVALGMELEWAATARASFDATVAALLRGDVASARIAWRHCLFYLAQLPSPAVDHLVAELGAGEPADQVPVVADLLTGVRRALAGRPPRTDSLAR